ncbi:UNVERIFIED_CONTAM: hypothetical protein HHA_456290 [Hammondia hammondi]|eukprot:XP_008888946.1 hypothetical protein HHA_456290 [Hammondia hammondi]
MEGGSAETGSADLPEEASPVPGCSWWSMTSPAESLGPTPQGAESSPSAEDRVKMLESELRLLRARRSNLISMRRNFRYKWKNEDSYVRTKMLRLNYRRKAKNTNTVGLSSALHQQLSQQYRERAPQQLARVEELSRQIMALEEEANRVTVQLLLARRSSDQAAARQTQASTVASATERAETSKRAGQHSPRDTSHVPSDSAERHSEPAFETPGEDAPVSRFIAQVPAPSLAPVTTTERASRESASSPSTMFSLARSVPASGGRCTHVEGTSQSPPLSIWQQQKHPSFQSGTLQLQSVPQMLAAQSAAGDPRATVSSGPWTTEDCGEPPYSLPPPFAYPVVAYAAGHPLTESDIPEDVVEFVLSHSAPAVTSSGDVTARLAESAPSIIQPWSPEYSPPPIVSPTEQASTSASWPQLSTSASDDGATLFAVPASSGAPSRPWWSSPQAEPSWRRHSTHVDTHPNSDTPASREDAVEIRYQRQGGSYVATWMEHYVPHLNGS